MSRHTRWCFVLNNPKELPDDPKYLEGATWWDRFGKNLLYGVCQYERGVVGQTMHLQGFVAFKERCGVSAAAMQRALPGSWHTRAKGSAFDNRKYCTKEDTRVEGPWEFGTCPEEKQGSRSDLEDIRLMFEEGRTMQEVAEKHFGSFVRYYKGFEKYMSFRMKKRSERTRFILHIGEPGTGKTTGVIEKYPDAYWMIDNGYWDDYNGEETVVFDEFVGWCPYHTLMRYGDSTPMRIHARYGDKQFLAKRLILISNKFPWDWYNYKEKNLDMRSLFRRFDVIYFHQKDQDPVEFLDWMHFVKWMWDIGVNVPAGVELKVSNGKEEVDEDEELTSGSLTD